MSNADAPARFTLRDLPLPAKVVITCFLLAVGLGYTSAMVQLHFQDAKTGKPMPTMEDVVLKFTGKKWFTEEPPRPPSKFVKLLITPAGAPFNGTGTMAPAFTTRDGGEFMRSVRGAESKRAELLPQRDGERDVLVLWAEAAPDVRKKAFEDDHFGVEPGKEPKAMTPEFKTADGAYKVKSIIEARCTRCHMPDGADAAAGNYPLVTYAHMDKYLGTPTNSTFRKGGDWVRIEEPMSLEKLTQSTHAHLLSFAVLFSLTGLVFAFTSYPTAVRCVVGPLVLIAIVTDVCFWWLARMSDAYGVYFAMGVIGTGGVAGLGLGAQITLSLWNMYGPKGKVVLLVLFALAGAAGGLVMKSVVMPGLEEKKRQIEQAKADEENKDKNGEGAAKPPEKKEPEPKPPEKKDPPKVEPPKKEPEKKDVPVVAPKAAASRLDQVLAIPDGTTGEAVWKLPFKKEPEWNMVRAFFDQDGQGAKGFGKMAAAQQEKVAPERHGELAAMLAWGKLPDAERKKAFEADAFELPAALKGKPLTAEYVKDGKVKVQSLVNDRCVRCHATDTENATFEDYAGLKKYLDPVKTGR